MLCPLLLLAAASLAPAHADAAADAKKSIQVQYDKRDAALANFDIEGYLAIYNSNYLNMSRGEAKPDQQRQALIRSWARLQKISRQESVQSVMMTPDGATIMTSSVTHAYGLDPQTKQPFATVIRETDRSFWVSTRAGWRMKQERRIPPVLPAPAVTPAIAVPAVTPATPAKTKKATMPAPAKKAAPPAKLKKTAPPAKTQKASPPAKAKKMTVPAKKAMPPAAVPEPDTAPEG